MGCIESRKTIDYIDDILAKYSDENYTFRIIETFDYKRGYYETLRCYIDKDEDDPIQYKDEFDEIINTMNNFKYMHKVVVVEYNRALYESQSIVGVGTIIIKPSIKYHSKLVGYICDIGVRPEHQSNKLANKMLALLIEISKKVKCEKIILETYIEAIKYFQRKGFKRENDFLVGNISPFDNKV